MPIVSILQARALVESAMTVIGHSRSEAEIIADHILDCELRGLSFGGLSRALSVVERIRATPDRRQSITIERQGPVSAALDGGDHVGYLVGRRATEIALDKARTHGLAVVGARNTWYTGMFSYYLEMVTAAGFAGMAAGSAAQFVAPHGGTEGRFGSNPIAFGFPTEDQPVIWDIGTSQLMYGEAVLSQRLDRPLVDGMAFDAQGIPTTDPAAALEGAFTVWGGHKGSGLAMVVQLLGMMCGASSSPVGVSDVGFFLLVIDPELLTSGEDYRRRVSDYADTLRATRPVDPAQPVRAPFDRSAATRRQTLAAGQIDVSDPVWQALRQVADHTPRTPAGDPR
jgi:LDH2 family malate/lactate/ureidoglycolate dehydrogenase